MFTLDLMFHDYNGTVLLSLLFGTEKILNAHYSSSDYAFPSPLHMSTAGRHPFHLLFCHVNHCLNLLFTRLIPFCAVCGTAQS